jgi:xylulokinase
MEALAILECQMMNYASRSAAILSHEGTARLARVYAAGGAARNKTLLRVMADALGCPVSKAVEYDPEAGMWGEVQTNACSVGVAYKAAWGWVRATDKSRANVPFDDFVAAAHARSRATLPAEAATACHAPSENGKYDAALPGPGAAAYKRALPWWRELEARSIKEGKAGNKGLHLK